jgi:hypothetical protein
MPGHRPAHCKVCGKHESEVGTISWRGNCAVHGKPRMNDNFEAMKDGRGPYANWWAYQLADSLGFAPLDGAPERP